jgi:hypothetical protein
MEGDRFWSMEAKVFEVRIKGGDTGVRIFESNKRKKSSIFVRRDELAWLIGALEVVVDAEKTEIFWDQSRAGCPRILAQKRSNKHGRFVSIEEYEGRRRNGIILVPEGRYGQGWARLMVELDGANSFLWEGRASKEHKETKGETARRGPSVVLESSSQPKLMRSHGKGGEQLMSSDNMNRKMAMKENSHCASLPVKTHGLKGSVPNSVCSGDEFCGGAGAVGLLGGALPKDRWLQALLSTVPHVQGEACQVACQAAQGQVNTREKAVSEEEGHAFNAIDELHRCRAWLRRLRGEVDAGLQRLDFLLQNVTANGPGQVRLDVGGVSKPKGISEPRGKKPCIPKASGVGLVLGPKDCDPSKKLKMIGASPAVGLGLKVGSSRPSGLNFNKEGGRFRRPSGVGGPGMMAGPSGLDKHDESGPVLEGDPPGFVVEGQVGLADSSRGKGVVLEAPTARLGSSGSVAINDSRSEAGMELGVGCSEPMSRGGVSGPRQKLPTMVRMEPGGSTPVNSRNGCFEVDLVPTQLRIYQRSRGRTSKFTKARVVSREPGQPAGQPESSISLPVSPVRLSFEGVGVDSCDSGDVGSSEGKMDVPLDSADFVQESVAEVDSSTTSKSGANQMENEELHFTLGAGEIMGMTCDGKVGQLKEVMGKLVAEKQGRGLEVERGSQVFNEL